MSGLIILFILGVWGYASHSLAKFIVKPIKNSSTKSTASIVVTTLLFLAPVADDIIGGFQFRALCHDNAVVLINEEKARGKTFIYQRVKDRKLNTYLIPILERYWSYKESVSGEVIMSWITYDAKGGWLSRTIGFPEGSPPYTFDGSCIPKNSFDYNFKKNNIQIKYKE